LGGLKYNKHNRDYITRELPTSKWTHFRESVTGLVRLDLKMLTIVIQPSWRRILGQIKRRLYYLGRTEVSITLSRISGVPNESG